jgi:hypothetical protein
MIGHDLQLDDFPLLYEEDSDTPLVLNQRLMWLGRPSPERNHQAIRTRLDLNGRKRFRTKRMVEILENLGTPDTAAEENLVSEHGFQKRGVVRSERGLRVFYDPAMHRVRLSRIGGHCVGGGHLNRPESAVDPADDELELIDTNSNGAARGSRCRVASRSEALPVARGVTKVLRRTMHR